MSKFGREIDVRYPVFFGSDNSDEGKFESKSSSDNRNVKKFNVRILNSDEKFLSVPDFFRVGRIRVFRSNKFLPALVKGVSWVAVTAPGWSISLLTTCGSAGIQVGP